MHLQALYRSYSVKQRRPFLKCFLAVSLLYDLYCLIVPLEQDLLNRGLTTFFAGANLCLLGVSFKARRRFIWTTLPHLAWHAANLQILARMFLGQDLTPRDDLGWVLVIEYLIYVTLPLNLRYCLILAIGTFATYVVCLIGLMRSDGNLEYQLLASLACAQLKMDECTKPVRSSRKASS
ncbi:hypothetical protein O3M35_004871 [Rhynocoris fuscipes]|uniref:Uncharacterized protein n=1 Tax=Rhynocoris fuscipes TaxID=488301 RepID=A0AAW1DHI3_9HEMI